MAPAGAPLHNLSSRLTKQRHCLHNATLQCEQLRADFIVPDVVAFVTSMGRMKFVRPLYRALAGWPEQKAAAASTFAAHADSYHPIARKMLAQDLKA